MDVGVVVAEWVGDRRSDAGAGGEVYDNVEGVLFEDFVDGGGVADVCFDEVEVFGVADLGEVFFFDGSRVGGVKVVQGDDVLLVVYEFVA